MNEHIRLGKWTQETLDHTIREYSKMLRAGSRIHAISQQFLSIEYKESTLIGDMDSPEVFVINLEGLDCFTFIDYVEAMRLSKSFSEFKEKLKKVRYRSGTISFENRNHFFTDWRVFNSCFVQDVTERIGHQHTVTIQKTLNKRADGTNFVQGIPPVERTVTYVPSDVMDDSVCKKLLTGDYVGIYSRMPGLDVSHVGIIIKDRDSTYLRHASSEKEQRKVIDQDFKKYVSATPGIVVLRPKDSLNAGQ